MRELIVTTADNNDKLLVKIEEKSSCSFCDDGDKTIVSDIDDNFGICTDCITQMYKLINPKK